MEVDYWMVFRLGSESCCSGSDDDYSDSRLGTDGEKIRWRLLRWRRGGSTRGENGKMTGWMV